MIGSCFHEQFFAARYKTRKEKQNTLQELQKNYFPKLNSEEALQEASKYFLTGVKPDNSSLQLDVKTRNQINTIRQHQDFWRSQKAATDSAVIAALSLYIKHCKKNKIDANYEGFKKFVGEDNVKNHVPLFGDRELKTILSRDVDLDKDTYKGKKLLAFIVEGTQESSPLMSLLEKPVTPPAAIEERDSASSIATTNLTSSGEEGDESVEIIKYKFPAEKRSFEHMYNLYKINKTYSGWASIKSLFIEQFKIKEGDSHISGCKRDTPVNQRLGDDLDFTCGSKLLQTNTLRIIEFDYMASELDLDEKNFCLILYRFYIRKIESSQLNKVLEKENSAFLTLFKKAELEGRLDFLSNLIKVVQIYFLLFTQNTLNEEENQFLLKNIQVMLKKISKIQQFATKTRSSQLHIEYPCKDVSKDSVRVFISDIGQMTKIVEDCILSTSPLWIEARYGGVGVVVKGFIEKIDSELISEEISCFFKNNYGIKIQDKHAKYEIGQRKFIVKVEKIKQLAEELKKEDIIETFLNKIIETKEKQISHLSTRIKSENKKRLQTMERGGAEDILKNISADTGAIERVKSAVAELKKQLSENNQELNQLLKKYVNEELMPFLNRYMQSHVENPFFGSCLSSYVVRPAKELKEQQQASFFDTLDEFLKVAEELHKMDGPVIIKSVYVDKPVVNSEDDDYSLLAPKAPPQDSKECSMGDHHSSEQNVVPPTATGILYMC